MGINKEYYNLKEASDLTKTCLQTLRRAIAKKELKAQKIGRAFVIKGEDLKAYIKARYGTEDLKTIEALTKAI